MGNKETVTENFLKDVEDLKLRFPVAEISEKTGYDKGYVSKLLKGDTSPSKNFLNKFNEKFYPDKTLNDGIVPYMTTQEYIDSLKKQISDKDLLIEMLKQKIETDRLLIEELQAGRGKAGGRQRSA